MTERDAEQKSLLRQLDISIPRTVQPDELMVFPILGMGEQRSLKYFQRYGFGENAMKTLERLLVAPPSERALEGVLRKYVVRPPLTSSG